MSVEVGDRELPSDIETFVRGEDQGLKPYRVGGYAYLPEATQTMPGLSATPAAFNVDIDETGRTVGLF